MNWDVSQVFRYLRTWSAMRRSMDDMGDGFFNETYQRVAAVWIPSGSKKPVEMDFVLMVGRNEP